jgi:molybdopterin-guanine dinucleotide biosynthesis protein A
MGGQDKGQKHYRGKTLVSHVIDSVARQVDDIIISANRNLDQYRSFGFDVITDKNVDFAGPLAGLASTICYCKHNWILVVPCDMPSLPADLVSTMSNYIENTKLVVLSTGDRLQLVFLLHRDLLDSINQHVSRQQYSVMRWVDDIDHHIVAMDDENIFQNINTPEQLDD